MTYGTLDLAKGKYVLITAPEVRMVVKRLLLGCKVAGNIITTNQTDDSTENMRWILDRWPHEVTPHLLDLMDTRVAANRHDRQTARAIIAGDIEAPEPPDWNPDFPLRDYQRQAVALQRIKRGLLIGDDIGLGKTAEAIGIIASHPGKALVVCQTHLQTQWQQEIAQFCPSLRTHIIKTRKEYPLPAHDVTICSYSKLGAWAPLRQWETVIYDEVQELRHRNSGNGTEMTAKYSGAHHLATATNHRVGLSATPVYNYAGEIYNVMEALSPGTLGNPWEFAQEWGATPSNKMRVTDPEALGSWLRDQGVYIRRTRKDVGKELPEILRINHMVEHDPKIIDRLRAQANELAERVLHGGFHQAGVAGRQLDILLRQVTGIAKAPFVADFVEGLVRNGEQVLLAGWHREVYNVWHREFQAKGIESAFYTGNESAGQKGESARRFISGEAPVLIISLRSGAGLNGLQRVSQTCVIGELDWSPQVITQLVGRLNRDDQKGQVTLFTMISDAGADPIMASVLGAKYESATALTDPSLLTGIEATPVPTTRVADLAREWLYQHQKAL